MSAFNQTYCHRFVRKNSKNEIDGTLSTDDDEPTLFSGLTIAP